MELTRQQIMSRLRTKQVWITTTRTLLFNEAVPEGKERFVVNVQMNGNQISNQIVTIEKGEEGGTYTEKWHNTLITTNDVLRSLNPNPDLLNPILKMQGGSGLYGKVNGTSITATTIYYDDEI